MSVAEAGSTTFTTRHVDTDGNVLGTETVTKEHTLMGLVEETSKYLNDAYSAIFQKIDELNAQDSETAAGLGQEINALMQILKMTQDALTKALNTIAEAEQKPVAR